MGEIEGIEMFNPSHAAYCRVVLSAVLFFHWIRQGVMVSVDGVWWTVLTIMFSASLIVFISRKRLVVSSAVMFFLLAWVHHTVVRDYKGFDPNRPIMPAIVLLTYCATLGVLGEDRASEAMAWENCCAAVGACYTLAALSKLHDSGIGWVNSYSIRVAIAALPPACYPFLDVIRAFIIRAPLLALAASAITLGTELSGAAMLFRRLRPYYALLIISLHGIIAIGMSIYGYLLWSVLVAAMSFPISRLRKA